MNSDQFTKRCCDCKRRLPRGAFNKAKGRADGLQSQCRECARKYHEANREKALENRRRWRDANREKARESERRYSEANREKRREYKRRYRRANPKKKIAGNIISNVIAAGRFPRPTGCQICRSVKNLHWHHEDYDFPFSVVGLCVSCHSRLHAGWFSLIPEYSILSPEHPRCSMPPQPQPRPLADAQAG